MEYIPDARAITEYAQQMELGLRERLELFAEVCDAVHYGHEKGIIHRDLKPSNLLVDGEGQPRVIDFGVARSTDADVTAVTMQTETGQLIGTLQYMSPEQCEADPHNIDTRSDVYALGVVLYELLCGKLPYDLTGVTLHEATRIVREQGPTKLSTINARLRGDVETIVRKALQKDREHRYRSAAELADDLRHYLAGEAILARPPSVVYQLRVFARQNKALVGGVAAVFVALILGMIGTSVGLVRARDAEVEANRQRDEAARSRDEAVEVTRFLTDTLAAADLQQGRGPDVTVGQMLDEMARGLDREKTFADRPRVKATLHAAIGNAYRSLAAKRLTRSSLAISQKVYGENHFFVGHSFRNLGLLLCELGELDEAEELLDRALKTYRRAHVELPTKTLQTNIAVARSILGECYTKQGRHDEAEEESLAGYGALEAAVGKEHPLTQRTAKRLAALYEARGEPEEAAKWQRQLP